MSRAQPTVLFSGRFLDLVQADGVEYVRNRVARGVVLIIPVTAAGELVLIENHRVPLQSQVIEFPAGLVGDEEGSREESFEAAARRELLEETGYVADTVSFLLRGPSSPGSSAEIVDFYLAPKVRKVASGGGVGAERLRVHAIDLGQVEQWLAAKTGAGAWVDPRVHLGLHYARRQWKAQ